MIGNRFLGGILLVAGTSTGAGMLALPVITSFAGFFPSVFSLIACWLFMFMTSLLLLEVNLAYPGAPNMISMAERTLGTTGKFVCWVVYLLLLYSLTAAYIAGSAPLFSQAFFYCTGIQMGAQLAPLPLLLFFGLFVYLGTRAVDQINRLLMGVLVAAYLALIIFLPPNIDAQLLARSDVSSVWMAIPVLFTSFGFHIIIPSLTPYLNHDRKKLRSIMLIGSLIPLGIYILWELMVIGVVPFCELSQAFASGDSAAVPLARVIQNPWIGLFASVFSFFAIITSFLGVSLSLSDFLGDGLRLHRYTMGREFACILAFMPPLGFVLLYERGFMMALEYAGLFVAVLLGILPALMAWKLKKYQHPVWKSILVSIVLGSLFVIGLCLR